MIIVKKIYPIKGRKDFFKYVVLENGKIAKGSGPFGATNVEMYFNEKESATRVANAKRRLNKLNKRWMAGKTSKKK